MSQQTVGSKQTVGSREPLTPRQTLVALAFLALAAGTGFVLGFLVLGLYAC